MALLDIQSEQSFDSGYLCGVVAALWAVFHTELAAHLHVRHECPDGFGVLLYDEQTDTYYDLARGANSTSFEHIYAHLQEYLKGYAELSQVDTSRTYPTLEV